jgi:hypothetical protein
LIKIRGKQVKRSLKIDNLAHVRRELKGLRRDQERIDPSAGKVTVESLCDRLLASGSPNCGKATGKSSLYQLQLLPEAGRITQFQASR